MRRTELLATLAVAVCGLLWGLFWIPLRALDGAGVTGGYAVAAFCIASVLVMLPVAIYRSRRLMIGGGPLLVTGIVAGSAFVLYSDSLLITDVVRAILLFYLTPVWSTLLGKVLLNERVTPARFAALALGLSGLVVILGVEGGFPMPRNAGDWFALLSGIAWAYASLRVFRNKQTAVFETMFIFFLGGIPLALLMLLLPLQGNEVVPGLNDYRNGFWPLAVLVLVFSIPSMFAIIWGARILSPGRVGILLMGEVVLGVASAAILTDEPFGMRELTGTILIVGAGLVEVLQQPAPAGAQRTPD